MRLFAVLLLTAVLAAAPGDWTPGEASSVFAHRAANGAHVVANVDLPDPCHEAMIREVHGDREFILSHSQKTVTVEARNKTFIVPVQ